MIPGREYSVRSVLRLIWARRFSLVLVAALGAGLAAGYVSRLPVRYQASAALLVTPQIVPQNYVRSTVAQDIEGLVRTLTERVLQRDNVTAIAKELQPSSDPKSLEAFVASIQRGITPEIIRADAFRISFTHGDAVMAARVTARVARAFIEENLRSRMSLAAEADDFIDAQLQSTRDRLTEIEAQLEEYRRTHAGELPSQVPANVQVIQSAHAQLQSVQQAIREDHDRKLQIEQTIATISRELPPAAEEATVEDTAEAQTDRLAQQALQADSREAAVLLPKVQAAAERLSLQLKPDHPDMARLRRLVAELERRAAGSTAPVPSGGASSASASNATYARLVAEIAAINKKLQEREADEERLRAIIQRYQSRIENSPTRETELTTLTRDYSTINESYRALLAKKEQSKMGTELERRRVGESLKIVEPARVPQEPSTPSRLQVVTIGALLGLALVLIYAALRELLDASFRTEREVRAALDLPVFAMIPIIVTTDDARRARLWAIGRLAAVALGIVWAVLTISRIAGWTRP